MTGSFQSSPLAPSAGKQASLGWVGTSPSTMAHSFSLWSSVAATHCICPELLLSLRNDLLELIPGCDCQRISSPNGSKPPSQAYAPRQHTVLQAPSLVPPLTAELGALTAHATACSFTLNTIYLVPINLTKHISQTFNPVTNNMF